MQIPTTPLSPAKAPKLEALDLVRVLCAVGIILYHISCYTAESTPKLFYTYANGYFGEVIVGIFLLVSGGVLYYNYPKVESLRVFWYKRWKSLFPMFYVTWLYYYINSVIAEGSFFYRGKRVLLLSLLGLDGYFSYRIDTYYKVGEWFLGAIVLLYALYPLFLKLIRRFDWKILLILVPLWLWQVNTDWFLIPDAWNLIYCSLLFVSGMLIFKHRLYRSKVLRLCSLAVSAVLLLVPLPALTAYLPAALTISAFFVLYALGELLMKWRPAGRVFSFLSGLTFPMFLVQNLVGNTLVYYLAPGSTGAVIRVSIAAVLLCIAYGWCIRAIAGSLTKTGWFQKFESFLLRR